MSLDNYKCNSKCYISFVSLFVFVFVIALSSLIRALSLFPPLWCFIIEVKALPRVCLLYICGPACIGICTVLVSLFVSFIIVVVLS